MKYNSLCRFRACGLCYRFCFEKDLKMDANYRRFLAGMFFVGVQLLQKYGYVSTVNWDKLGNDTSTHIRHWTTTADITNLHGLFHTIGIPISGGFGLGLLAGFVRTR
ncbi:MAG: FUN14 domain-containing protein [Candidatus Nitrosopolaris sp.]